MRLMRGLILAVLVAAAPAAHAGWVITDADGQETLVSNGMMRNGWDETSGMIVNGKDNKLIMYDGKQKAYAEGTMEELCEVTSSFMEMMMKDVPAEQREMMKKMMGHGDGTPTVEVKSKGGGEKIAGFATERYEVLVDGTLYEEVWLTDDKKLMKDFEPLRDALGSFVKCMSGLQAMGGTPPEATDEYLGLMKKGLALRTKSHRQGPESTSHDTTAVVEKKISDDAFKAPDGYRKVAFQELMMGMNQNPR
jgi:hypothetical protein